MAQSEFVGVDGCRGGWFSVGLDRGDGCEVEMFESFKELLDHYRYAKLVLVDIPIGLPVGPGGRDCDREARKLLGPRRSSVFPVPTRLPVEQAEASPHNYGGAMEVERRLAGKGISKQAFGIAPKIAEVNEVMLVLSEDASPSIREVHPELCFWALDGRQPMRYWKKKREGETERLRVLKGIEPWTPEVYDSARSKYLRRVVAKDDILDALVVAVAAHRSQTGRGRLRTIPEVPPKDAAGLPMEMVYLESI